VRALDIAQLRWQNRGKRHQGVGKAYLINGVGESTLDLIIDVDAPRCGSTGSRASSIWGPASWTSAPCWPDPRRASPVSGQLDFQLWSEFEARPGNSLLAFGNNYLIWKDEIRVSRTASTCRGKIQLRRDGEEWQLASHDVTFKLDGKPWLHSRLQLERIGSRIQGYVPAIDIDQIANLSQLVSGLYPELTETLKRTRPRASCRSWSCRPTGTGRGSPAGATAASGPGPGTMYPVCKSWTATSG
jgi:uncharacterized protein YhdP